jgi:hypothetical protein
MNQGIDRSDELREWYAEDNPDGIEQTPLFANAVLSRSALRELSVKARWVSLVARKGRSNAVYQCGDVGGHHSGGDRVTGLRP